MRIIPKPSEIDTSTNFIGSNLGRNEPEVIAANITRLLQAKAFAQDDDSWMSFTRSEYTELTRLGEPEGQKDSHLGDLGLVQDEGLVRRVSAIPLMPWTRMEVTGQFIDTVEQFWKLGHIPTAEAV